MLSFDHLPKLPAGSSLLAKLCAAQSQCSSLAVGPTATTMFPLPNTQTVHINQVYSMPFSTLPRVDAARRLLFIGQVVRCPSCGCPKAGRPTGPGPSSGTALCHWHDSHPGAAGSSYSTRRSTPCLTAAAAAATAAATAAASSTSSSSLLSSRSRRSRSAPSCCCGQWWWCWWRGCSAYAWGNCSH